MSHSSDPDFTRKIIELLRVQKSKPITNSTELNTWKTATANLIKRAYGSDSHFDKELREIEYWSGGSFGGVDWMTGKQWQTDTPDNISECKIRACALIESVIVDLVSFGIPAPAPAPAPSNLIDINVNQTVNLSLFVQTIRDSLEEDQIKALREILSSDSTPEAKKSTLLSKLKSFGNDVLANVTANILTNPQVYASL